MPDLQTLARSQVSAHVQQLLTSGDKMGAIKAYRAEANVDLLHREPVHRVALTPRFNNPCSNTSGRGVVPLPDRTEPRQITGEITCGRRDRFEGSWRSRQPNGLAPLVCYAPAIGSRCRRSPDDGRPRRTTECTPPDAHEPDRGWSSKLRWPIR